ncbi:MAG TPA: DnaJ domain-containing protein [Blastocatellia bacterium]|nr:DnaJ domain-containing protein [Blastocatellia bacterium]
MQGQLGEKLIADVIREIAEKKASGLLRVSRGKSIKAIFFESGAPVFAISNVSAEQLEYRLLKGGLATSEQIERAKRGDSKANRLGPALVEMGVLSDDLMRQTVRGLVMEIILSLFEWNQGDYALDERIRVAHEVTLDTSATDVILEGARHAARHEQIAEKIAPPEGLLVRAMANGFSRDSSKLLPIEGYVLSRIESPTEVGDVSTITGISEEEARRAVCALVAGGFLKLHGQDEDEEPEPAAEAGNAANQLLEEVNRKLHFFQSADHYDVLGVNRHAGNTDIKAAYYQLAKKFHPDRYRQSEDAELRSKLEALFARITLAYETLSDPVKRMPYDERLRKSPGGNPPEDAAAPPVTPTAPLAQERKSTGPLKTPASNKPPTGPLNKPAAEPEAVKSTPQSPPPGRTAEYYYQQGRARLDRKEYHIAVHMLREAVRLDPNKAHYHYHLGMALVRNPRTRREAEQHLVRAAELDPYNAQIRLRLGLLFKEAGLPKKAEHYFKEVLTMDPNNRIALRELGGGGVKKEAATSIWKSDLGGIAKRLFKR